MLVVIVDESGRSWRDYRTFEFVLYLACRNPTTLRRLDKVRSILLQRFHLRVIFLCTLLDAEADSCTR